MAQLAGGHDWFELRSLSFLYNCTSILIQPHLGITGSVDVVPWCHYFFTACSRHGRIAEAADPWTSDNTSTKLTVKDPYQDLRNLWRLIAILPLVVSLRS